MHCIAKPHPGLGPPTGRDPDDKMMFEAGHGTTPDLIYAKGIPCAPSPNPTSFDKKQCTLIIAEIGVCRDLGCDVKSDKKTEKYFPLIAALRRYWGRVEFIAFPIGHAGTTLISIRIPPDIAPSYLCPL